MNNSMKGKVTLITGAARGIGLCIAEDLAKQGVRICGVDKRRDELESQMLRLQEQYGIETISQSADVSIEKDVISLVKNTFSKWATIDILVNNAGIRKVASVEDLDTATWDEIQNVNLKSQFLCSREVLKQGMRKNNEGVIIFISSGSGKRGERNSSAYCASKFGIFGFAESLAKELKPTNIRVTTIAPGMIWTPMAEESEMAKLDVDWLPAEQVSKAVMFCINQDSDTIIPEMRIYHRSQI